MPTLYQTNCNRFDWESHSWFQSLKERLWEPSTARQLIQAIDQEADLTSIQAAVAYLANHPHAFLEQKLKETLPSAPPKTLQSICQFALITGRTKMIDVCRRIAKFEKEPAEIIKSARREAHLIPKQPRILEAVSQSISHQWNKHSQKAFGVIAGLNYRALLLTVGTFSSLSSKLMAIIQSPPTNLLELDKYFQYLIDNCKKLLENVTKLKTWYYSWFSTAWKAHAIGLAVLTAGYGINFINKKLRLDTPANILIFTNASAEAAQGKHQPIHGRLKEKAEVMHAWNVAPGEKYRIGFLIGPPGTGKTEFVKQLAWESVYDSSSFVYGKKVFIVNTSELVKSGERYLDSILRSLEGSENDVILFFDEAHAAGNKGSGLGLVELLKTKLLERNIRCLLATTVDEFQQSLAVNTAFIDRCKPIDFKELPDDDTVLVLKDKVALDKKRIVEVEPDAFAAILKLGKTHPNYQKRANPRKAIDLYKDIMSHADTWVPRRLGDQLTEEIKNYNQIVDFCRSQNSNNPDWIDSPEGIKLSEQLETQAAKIATSKQNLAKQNQEFQTLTNHRKLVPLYRNQYYEVIHQIAQSEKPSSEILTHYLFLKHILRPAIHAVVQEELQAFKQNYLEEIPLSVNAALIESFYPQVSAAQKMVGQKSPIDSTIDMHSSDSTDHTAYRRSSSRTDVSNPNSSASESSDDISDSD